MAGGARRRRVGVHGDGRRHRLPRRHCGCGGRLPGLCAADQRGVGAVGRVRSGVPVCLPQEPHQQGGDPAAGDPACVLPKPALECTQACAAAAGVDQCAGLHGRQRGEGEQAAGGAGAEPQAGGRGVCGQQPADLGDGEGVRLAAEHPAAPSQGGPCDRREADGHVRPGFYEDPRPLAAARRDAA